MAITSKTVVGVSHGVDGEGTRTYQLTYQVISNSAADGPVTIRGSVASTHPIGSGFFYGSDTDANARCDKISPQLSLADHGKSTWKWTVSVDFTTRPRRKCEEETPDDPLDEAPEIQWLAEQFQKAVERADRMEGDNVVEGNVIPMNSAFTPIDPPLERDDSRLTLTITRNEASYDANLAINYHDAVNSDAFTVDGQNVLKGAAKIHAITGVKQYKGSCEPYYKVTYVIHFRADGWDQERIDAGFQVADIELGEIEVIRDKSGQPVSEPKRLDGNGDVLPPNGETVYLKWRVYEHKNFSALSLPQEQ